MKADQRHPWDITPTQAIALQGELTGQVIKAGNIYHPNLIAGVDVAIYRSREEATAAVVLLRYPELTPVEVRVLEGKVGFPYIPGLLSFREAPLILAAFEKLKLTPDLVIVDGQGVAHPRRFGIASHLGLLLDIPTIGCAKSRLCGKHGAPGAEAGSYAPLTDRGEVIGVALRTRASTSPVYISVGHKIGLENAIYWALECCRGFRIPEPTRLAHLAAGGNLQPDGSQETPVQASL